MPDLQPNSPAIGQKDGEKWATAVDLQPAISKSDRLLGACANTNLDEARRLRDKAERIIRAPEPPPRCSEDPAWFECRWCPFRDICHGEKMPAVNARTCAHATPELDGNGRWSCARCQRDLTPAEQARPCPHHRYIPALVTFAEAVDANEGENWIEYRLPDGRLFRNGDPATAKPGAPVTLTSQELPAGRHAVGLALDPVVAALRGEGARISAAGPRMEWKEEVA